jgi:hypothetical protein
VLERRIDLTIKDALDGGSDYGEIAKACAVFRQAIRQRWLRRSGWPTARTTAAAMWPSLARSWSTRPTVHCLVSLVPYRSWPAMCQARMMQGCISLPVSNEIYVGRPTRHPPDPGELAERSSGSTNWRPSSASRARLSWPGFRRWENSSARLPRPSSTSLPGSSENSSRRRPSASLVRQASCAPANRLGRPHRV